MGWQNALWGVLGGAIPELVRVIASLRANQRPTSKELLASVLAALLGLGALLFASDGDNPLKVAVLGASFPQLFSGLVAASTAKPPSTEPTRGSARPKGRTVWDYLGWRLEVPPQ